MRTRRKRREYWTTRVMDFIFMGAWHPLGALILSAVIALVLALASGGTRAGLLVIAIYLALGGLAFGISRATRARRRRRASTRPTR